MKGFFERLRLRYAYVKPLHKILDDKYYDNFMTAVQKAGYSSELSIKSGKRAQGRQQDPKTKRPRQYELDISCHSMFIYL